MIVNNKQIARQHSCQTNFRPGQGAVDILHTSVVLSPCKI